MIESRTSIWDECTGLYKLKKTLRFRLKPIGKTEEFIIERKIIENDEELARDSERAKKIIDEYYRNFIADRLRNTKISLDSLKEYEKKYLELKKDKKNKNATKEFSTIQKNLIKEVHDKFFEGTQKNELFEDDLIKNRLPNWLEKEKREEDRKLIEKFNKFVTYFHPFFEKRKNVFSNEEKSTSLFYRIVGENLPRYIDNIKKYEKISQYSDFDCSTLEKEFYHELGEKKLDEFFKLENFNEFLSQEGIDRFNLVIGGKSLEGNKKIQGLNELINLYSQKQPEDKKREIKKLLMVPLYKQILGEKNTFSFAEAKIEDDVEVVSTLHEFYTGISNEFEIIKNIFENILQYDASGIYLKKSSLSYISKEIYNEWDLINRGLDAYAQKDLKTKKERDAWLKKTYFSLEEIKQSLSCLDEEGKYWQTFFEYYAGKNSIITKLIDQVKEKYSQLSELKPTKNEKALTKEENYKDVEKIKEFLDVAMQLYKIIKPFNLRNKEESSPLEINAEFYNKFEEAYEPFEKIVGVYNRIRNYVTQKPFSTDKIKITFKKSKLLNGWDVNKVKDCRGIILEKEGKYFLGIIEDTEEFDRIKKKEEVKGPAYKLVEYKLIPEPAKELAHVFFSEKYKKMYPIPKEIEEIRKYASYSKNAKLQDGYEKKEFKIEDCHKMINFYKEGIKKHPEWNKKFNFKFKETSEYKDIKEFFQDVHNQAYEIEYEYIPESEINQMVNDGKLYLFQLWNKDFSPYSKGRKNLHTLYWQALFSEENLKDVKFKLDGGAEIFFRNKSIENPTIHRAGGPIENKNPIREKERSIFKYDIIKDRRYTENQFFLHCPITLNFKLEELKRKDLNKNINEIIEKNHSKVNILSIDRGERNLLYYTLLSPEGRIIEQKSLNILYDDINRKHSYWDKLDELEQERKRARVNWSKIKNIKEMKEGYLSKAVHDICKMAVEHNAVIVLEDLNTEFKRGRSKIEKQVYQKFEKMLINKLNYLVFKDREETQKGGLLNAYQLTSQFTSFEEIGKQTGIIFYVDAGYTSAICPKTGFVNMLHPKYTNIKAAQDFFKRFKSIRYNSKEKYFEFTFKYADFLEKDSKNEYNQKEWTVCSFGTRFVIKKKNNLITGETEEVHVTEKLKDLFKKEGITYEDERNLVKEIIKSENKTFFEELIYLLRLVLQMRNFDSQKNEDFILSCVRDASGNFFDSRRADKDEPQNADANGALHIGLKGILTIKKIIKGEKPHVDREEYLEYVIARH